MRNRVQNSNVGPVNTEPQQSFFLRRKEAASRLKISLGLFDQLVDRRVLPCVQLSSRVKLFRAADLDRALEKLTVEVAS